MCCRVSRSGVGKLASESKPPVNAPEPLLTRTFLLPWRGRLLALAAAALVWLFWAWFAPASLQQIDERSTDLLWQVSASTEAEHRVVLVDIDDASLSRLGPWPWPRKTMAELTRKLDEQGVGLKLFDVVFPEGRDGQSELSRAFTARDAVAPTVMAQVFSLNNESQLQSGELAGALPGLGCQTPAMAAQGYIANAPGLHTRAGHITPALDADGAVRRVPALVCFGGRTYTTLTLAGVMASGSAPLLSEPAGLAMRIQRGAGPWAPAWQASLAALPGLPVGLDAQGQMRVPYRQARSAYTSVSAADVLQGKIPPGVLQGAWVIVGASAFGLTDAVPTALGRRVSGAEVHAQLLSAIIDGAVPYTPAAAMWLQLGFVLLATGLLCMLASNHPLHQKHPLLQRQRVLLMPVAALFLAAAAYGLHALAMLKFGWYLGWSGPALATILAGGALGLAEHKRSLLEKSRLYRNLASYVPVPVAEKIAFTVPSGNIEAQRREVTVLSADLNNFSAYCEARTPEETAKVLHRFYSTASDIIAAHGGIVEEMVGDSLLALFNGPLPCEEHPAKALAAARELWLRCSEELPNLSGQKLEPLGVSVGLESGVALVGSFGSAGRRVHTVLGQVVSTALRLRDMTVDLAYPVLVGPAAAAIIRPLFASQADDLALKPLGSFLLPGLQSSREIYTLRNLLQPGSPQEQQNLRYLHQVNTAA